MVLEIREYAVSEPPSILRQGAPPNISKYVGHLESKERLRIQPAQLFNFS